MAENLKRAEIVASGLVQGVGFRYFVLRKAGNLGLKGFVKNLYSGEVLTVAEGEVAMIEELFKQIRIGPSHASVTNCVIEWSEYKNEFKGFEVRY
jgi:acylphosphatase